MELWVFRHPPSLWNEERKCQGQHPDAPGLSLRGWLQAKKIAEYLGQFALHSIHTSPARRAVDLATLIQERQTSRISIFVEPDLAEMQMGAAEGLTEEEVEKIYPLSWAQWLKGTFESDLPCFIGGETPERVALRIEKTLSRLAKETLYSSEPIVVVSHGAALAFAFARIAHISLSRATFLANGSLSKVIWKHGLRIVEKNGIVHLGDTAYSPEIKI